MLYIEADRWVLKIFQHIDINFNKKILINLYSDRLKHLPSKTNFNSSLSLSKPLSEDFMGLGLSSNLFKSSTS